MNMTLSKRGDYVVRSALALARAYPTGEPRKIRQVVAEMGVPQTFASQILADLVRAGLATSKAGKGGGYRLARPPEQIPLVEVVEAGEGPLRAERCALGEGPCRWESVCPLHETWRAATNALRQVLGATTLADVAARDIEIEQGHVVAPPDSHRHGGASLSVEDFVQVEASCTTIADRLRDGVLAAEAVAAAYHQADQLRSELRPGTLAWSPVDVAASCTPGSPHAPDQRATTAPQAPTARSVAAASRDITVVQGFTVAQASAATTGGELATTDTSCIALELAFEATGTTGNESHGELALSITPIDPERSELRAVGRLRLPSLHDAAADLEVTAEPDIALRLAQVLLRTLLRRLAATLEEPLPPPPTRRSRSTASRSTSTSRGASTPVTTRPARRGARPSAPRATTEEPLFPPATGGSASTVTRPASGPRSTPAGRRGRATSAQPPAAPSTRHPARQRST